MTASSALREIAGGDEELLSQLVSELSAALSTSIELLRGAVGDEEWRQRAHRLKGGALAIGCDRIAALAVHAEAHPDDRKTQLEKIDRAFAEEFSGSR